VGDYYGVRWVSNYILRDDPDLPPWWAGRVFPDQYPETKILPTGEHPFHMPYAFHFDPMFIEPPVYLNAMLRDFYLAGGKLEVKRFEDRRELAALSEPVLINCTGLGARDLFDDKEFTPIKGQLTVLLPHRDVDYLLIHRGTICFPAETASCSAAPTNAANGLWRSIKKRYVGLLQVIRNYLIKCAAR
jgi:D-amino-acid oxidase